MHVIDEDAGGRLFVSPRNAASGAAQLISTSTPTASSKRQSLSPKDSSSNAIETGRRLARMETALSHLAEAVSRIEQRQLIQETASAACAAPAASSQAGTSGYFWRKNSMLRKPSMVPGGSPWLEAGTSQAPPTEEEEAAQERQAAEIAAAEEAQAAAQRPCLSRSTSGHAAPALSGLRAVLARSSRDTRSSRGSSRRMASLRRSRGSSGASTPERGTSNPAGPAVAAAAQQHQPEHGDGNGEDAGHGGAHGGSAAAGTRLFEQDGAFPHEPPSSTPPAVHASQMVAQPSRQSVEGHGLVLPRSDPPPPLVELGSLDLFGDLYEGGHAGHNSSGSPDNVPFGVLLPWSRSILAWDLICSSMLLIMCFYLPLRLAFLSEQMLQWPEDAWLLAIDVIYVMDMFVSMNTAYYDYLGNLETRRWHVFRHYIRVSESAHSHNKVAPIALLACHARIR
jgi:hypothetical protein